MRAEVRLLLAAGFDLGLILAAQLVEAHAAVVRGLRADARVAPPVDIEVRERALAARQRNL